MKNSYSIAFDIHQRKQSFLFLPLGKNDILLIDIVYVTMCDVKSIVYVDFRL